jgi:hypothetical protein
VKKYLFALAMSLALPMCAVAHAQTTHLNATVPFEFTVGDTTLPAGEYDIQATSPWGGKILCIRNLNANASAFVISTSYMATKKSHRSELIFNHYGQQYFLAEVWAGNDLGRNIPISSHRVELAKGQTKSEVVLMASGK